MGPCAEFTQGPAFREILSYASGVGVGVEVEGSGSNCQGCNSCLPYQTIPNAR
jgi:hypothetical protein